MISIRKIKANQANAKASTGPKTTYGKSRAAQNARRHGLSLSIRSDPTLSAEAENLTRQIAGEGAATNIFELARGIAEAQTDLSRVRQERQKLFSTELIEAPREPKRTKKLVHILSDLTKQLVAMDRYERRALSRRKFAIRALDALRRQAE